jgi:hypothetical protein
MGLVHFIFMHWEYLLSTVLFLMSMVYFVGVCLFSTLYIRELVEKGKKLND